MVTIGHPHACMVATRTNRYFDRERRILRFWDEITRLTEQFEQAYSGRRFPATGC